MLEILYYIFIFPLEQVLDYTLFVLHKLSGSYGLSIVALSLLVNALMLKITLLFERKGRAVQARKIACDSKIAEFKRVFKGAELQSYIRTLYKQRHFHPIHTLAGLGGLAVQIPFFIAILHLVEHSNFLQGVSFLWISDLSKPDSVSWLESLHLLPLIMTALTLINVFYSVQERGARIQGVLIALLFLVLLYSMPSALVLYWSCNMAFSLAKEVVKKWRGKREGAESKGLDSKRGQSLDKASESVWSNNKAQNLHSKHDSLGGVRNLRYVDGRGQGGIAVSKGCNALAQKGFISRVVYSVFPPHSALDSKSYATYRDISIFAILNICFMICVFTPYAVYSSDVSQFDVSQTYQTLGVLFGCFLLSSLGLIYLTSFLYKTRLLKLGAYGFSVLLLIGMVYTFVLVGNYGVMLDGMQFSEPERIYSVWNKFVDIGVILTCALLVCLVFKNVLYIALKIVLIALCGLALSNVVAIAYDKASVVQHEQALDKPPYTDKMLSFSKEENILVFVFDGFTGDHFSIMLEQFPELQNDFDGFVFYPNTLTTGAYTAFGTPAILGGYGYSSYYLSRNPNKFDEMSSQAFVKILNQMSSRYDVMLNGVGHISETRLVPKLNKGIRVFEPATLFKQYGDWFVGHVELGAHEIEFYKTKYEVFPELLSMGMFKFAPKVFKRFFYFPQEKWNGRYAWIFGDSLERDGFRRGLQYASFLQAYSLYSDTDSSRPTFKYFQDLTTHVPFLLNASNDCKPTNDMYETILPKTYQDKIPNYHNMNFTNTQAHYDNEVCAIRFMAKWIKWMKENEIYANSTIILTSDHGLEDGWRSAKDENGKNLGFAESALLMVKEKRASGKLKINTNLMSNADTLSFVCGALNDRQCVEQQLKMKQKGITHAVTDMVGNKPRINRLFLIEEGGISIINQAGVTSPKTSKMARSSLMA